MNNDSDGQPPNQIPLHELVPFQANGTMSLGETLVERVRRLEQAKKQLSAYEEETKAMYVKFLEEKQRLQTEVAQGQLAAYVPSSVRLSACDRRTCSSSQRLQDLDRAMAVQAK